MLCPVSLVQQMVKLEFFKIDSEIPKNFSQPASQGTKNLGWLKNVIIEIQISISPVSVRCLGRSTAKYSGQSNSARFVPK